MRRRILTTPTTAASALRRAQRRTQADFPARLELLLTALGAASRPKDANVSTLAGAVLDAIRPSIRTTETATGRPSRSALKVALPGEPCRYKWPAS